MRHRPCRDQHVPRVAQIEPVINHEVEKYNSGRPRNARMTVDKNLSTLPNGFLDELEALKEMAVELELGMIFRVDYQIDDAVVSVTSAGVRLVVGEELEDMSEPPIADMYGVGSREVASDVDIFINAVRRAVRVLLINGPQMLPLLSRAHGYIMSCLL